MDRPRAADDFATIPARMNYAISEEPGATRLARVQLVPNFRGAPAIKHGTTAEEPMVRTTLCWREVSVLRVSTRRVADDRAVGISKSQVYGNAPEDGNRGARFGCVQ